MLFESMIINLGQRGYIVFCFISILDNMDMNWFMIIRIKHESESEKYKYCWHRFFFLQRYAFLLKDARNFGKMFESEGDNKKSKEKRLFCCHYQNIYVLLQKQKNRGHHQHRIIWERALPGLRCKDKNKNGIYQRSFRKITSGRVCRYVVT